MPITKAVRGREPNWKEWDQKAQKSGLRHTVFCGGGDTYVGHWENNLKHGKGLLLCFRHYGVYFAWQYFLSYVTFNPIFHARLF